MDWDLGMQLVIPLRALAVQERPRARERIGSENDMTSSGTGCGSTPATCRSAIPAWISSVPPAPVPTPFGDEDERRESVIGEPRSRHHRRSPRREQARRTRLGGGQSADRVDAHAQALGAHAQGALPGGSSEAALVVGLRPRKGSSSSVLRIVRRTPAIMMSATVNWSHAIHVRPP